MIRVNYYYALVQVALALLLASCMSRRPDDLEITSVNRLAATSAMEYSGDALSPSQPPLGGSTDVLRINLATSLDILRYASKFGSGVGVNLRFCDLPPTPIRSSLLLGGERVASNSSVSLKKRIPDVGLYRFRIYAYVANEVPPGATLGRITYDISRSPRSICLDLSGGNETGFGFRSNCVYI